MNTTDLVQKWLKEHTFNDVQDVSDDDYQHFANILLDLAATTQKDTICDAAKWIRDNVSASSAVDYLKAMEE